jgi:hypothetical protein
MVNAFHHQNNHNQGHFKYYWKKSVIFRKILDLSIRKNKDEQITFQVWFFIRREHQDT